VVVAGTLEIEASISLALFGVGEERGTRKVKVGVGGGIEKEKRN
jgi:hypothetical protein